MSELKFKITQYVNENLKDEKEEDYEIEELFHNNSITNGKLTFCGFRHLKKIYTFYETSFLLNDTPTEYNTLCHSLTGFFYIYGSKTKDKHIRIQTTDKKFVNKIKLCNYDFEVFKNEYLRKKSQSSS